MKRGREGVKRKEEGLREEGGVVKRGRRRG